jgi:hypothetical protein
MKHSYIIIILLLFIIGCAEESIEKYGDEEIVGRYDHSGGTWVDWHDRANTIGFNLPSQVSIKDGCYLLTFDSHAFISLPEFYLEVYDKNEFLGLTSYHYFRLCENSSFVNVGYESTDNNYFKVVPQEMPFPSIEIHLAIRSIEPDSNYFIYYHASKFN